MFYRLLSLSLSFTYIKNKVKLMVFIIKYEYKQSRGETYKPFLSCHGEVKKLFIWTSTFALLEIAYISIWVFIFCQSILEYNGAAIIAMKGRDCVAIASDRRFGIQAQTVSTNFQKIFEMGPRLYIGLPGLATDVQTV